MRTQDRSTLSSSGREKGGPTESLVSPNSDSEALQKEQKDFLKSLAPVPPPHKEVPGTKPIFPSAGRSRFRGTLGPVLKFILQVLTAYLVFVATSGSIPESLSEAPCKLSAIAQHFPHCRREPAPPAEPASTVIVTPDPVISQHLPHSTPEPAPPEEPIVIIIPDFVTLTQLQSKLGQVMEHTAHSSKVAVDIKDSELALRDLRALVAHSALSNKVVLKRNLKNFVQDARATSESLQRFGSRVWGAVDQVVSLNENTLIMLENTPTERGLAIAHQKGLESIWKQGIDLLDQTLYKLIHEAQADVGALQRLEEKLNTIEDMVSVEKEEVRRNEQELKRDWFKETLGRNEEKHQSNSAGLELLTAVKDDRKTALKHVTEALRQLKRMSYDLDNLKDRVAAPMLVTSIPIEAHIKNMRGGTERLLNGQTRMREIEDEYRKGKFAAD